MTTLTGKLNGAGDSVVVFPNGLAKVGDIQDEIVGNKAIKRVGVVDLGTLDWVYAIGSSHKRFADTSILSSIKVPDGNDVLPNVVCLIPFLDHTTFWSLTLNENNENRTLGDVHSSALLIYSPTYTNAADFKAAMQGVLLYYELATPEEYVLDETPEWNYRVDDFGTERVIPSYSSSEITAPIAYDVQYAMNAVDAIRRLDTNYVRRDNVKQVPGQSETDVLSQKAVDDNYARKVGVENDLVVGAAKALAGNQRQVKEFSTMVMEGADGIAKINEVRGKSLVWNQLIQNGNFDNGTTGWNFSRASGSVANNECTITTGTEPAATTQFSQNVSILVGHKYYIAFDFAGLVSESLRVVAGGSYAMMPTLEYTSSTKMRLKAISTVPSSQSFISFYPNRYSTAAASTDICKIKNVVLIDLTLMFGAGNEPATVEEFEALFPLPYYDYNAGEIISNKTEKLDVVGFNQWDEEWEVGGLSETTGNSISAQSVRSKNYIPVIAESDYFFKVRYAGTSGIYVKGYDANKTVIGSTWLFSNVSNAIKTIPSGVSYIRFMTLAGYGTTYNHDICINISDPVKNGTYEPYKSTDIPLNLPTITGKLNGEGVSVVVFPNGLRGAGTAYDYLIVDADGYARKAVKVMDKVDLGALDWIRYTSDSTVFYAPLNGASYDYKNSISARYQQASGPYGQVNSEDKSYNFWPRSSTRQIYINDSSYTDAATFKSAMSGVELVYGLATPLTYDLDEPIPMTFMAYHGGTLRQTPQAPDSAPVVVNMTYAIDAVSILTGLPEDYVSKESLQAMLTAMQSAGLFASYTMTFNESTGKYEFTFTANS